MIKRWMFLMVPMMLVLSGCDQQPAPTATVASLEERATLQAATEQTSTEPVSAEQAATPTPAPLPTAIIDYMAGQPFEGYTEPGVPLTVYMRTTALTGFEIVATPEDGQDIALAVQDSTGNTLISVNRAGPGQPERIPEVFFPLDGHSVILISAEAGLGRVTGQATLDFNKRGVKFRGKDRAPSTYAIGPDSCHAYTFYGTPEDIIIFLAEPVAGDIDLTLIFYGPEGNTLHISRPADFRAAFVDDYLIREGGDYVVEVCNPTPNAGEYQVKYISGG